MIPSSLRGRIKYLQVLCRQTTLGICRQLVSSSLRPRPGRQCQEGGGRRRGQVRARHQQGGDLAVRQRRQVHGEVLGRGRRAHPHQNTPPTSSRTGRVAGMKGAGVQIGDKGTRPPLRSATRTAESCGFLSQAGVRLAPLSQIWTRSRRFRCSWPLVAPSDPPPGLAFAPHGSRAAAGTQDLGRPARGDELSVGVTSLSVAMSATRTRA